MGRKWGVLSAPENTHRDKLNEQLTIKLMEMLSKPPRPVIRLADMSPEKQAEMVRLYPPPARMGKRRKIPSVVLPVQREARLEVVGGIAPKPLIAYTDSDVHGVT